VTDEKGRGVAHEYYGRASYDDHVNLEYEYICT